MNQYYPRAIKKFLQELNDYSEKILITSKDREKLGHQVLQSSTKQINKFMDDDDFFYKKAEDSEASGSDN